MPLQVGATFVLSQRKLIGERGAPTSLSRFSLACLQPIGGAALRSFLHNLLAILPTTPGHRPSAEGKRPSRRSQRRRGSFCAVQGAECSPVFAVWHCRPSYSCLNCSAHWAHAKRGSSPSMWSFWQPDRAKSNRLSRRGHAARIHR